MYNANRRLKRVEKTLNVGQKEQRVVEIVVFGGALPPNHKEGNMTINYIAFEDIAKNECQ